MNDSLQKTLKRLRLSGLLQTLDVRVQEAASHGLNHHEFLELILQDELVVRDERLMNRRIKAAMFREQNEETHKKSSSLTSSQTSQNLNN